MPTYRLMERLPGPAGSRDKNLYALRQAIQAAHGDLEVAVELSASPEGWVSVHLEGEEVEVFLNYLDRHFGLAPTAQEAIATGKPARGFVEHFDAKMDRVVVQVSLADRDARGALGGEYLNRALASASRRPNLGELCRAFCLLRGVPLQLRVLGIRGGELEVELGEPQMRLFQEWNLDLLDRIVAAGATRRTAKNALARAKALRYVADIERLSFFCQVLTCKLGVNAAAMIERLRKTIPDAYLYLYSPLEIYQKVKPAELQPLQKLLSSGQSKNFVRRPERPTGFGSA